MNPVNTLVGYLRSSKEELEKVSWPSRQDTIRYSSLVLGVSVAVAVFFAGLDFGLNELTDAALKTRSLSPAAADSVPAPTAANVVPTTEPSPTPSIPGLDIQGSSKTITPGTPSTEPTQQKQ